MEEIVYNGPNYYVCDDFGQCEKPLLVWITMIWISISLVAEVPKKQKAECLSDELCPVDVILWIPYFSEIEHEKSACQLPNHRTSEAADGCSHHPGMLQESKPLSHNSFSVSDPDSVHVHPGHPSLHLSDVSDCVWSVRELGHGHCGNLPSNRPIRHSLRHQRLQNVYKKWFWDIIPTNRLFFSDFFAPKKVTSSAQSSVVVTKFRI